MKEFRILLETMKNLDEILAGFIALNKNGKLKSQRLKLLLSHSHEMEGGLFPDHYKEIIS